MLLLLSALPASATSPAAAGDVTLTEFQADPTRVPQYYGEWFELYNNTGGTLDFDGVTITNSAGQTVTVTRTTNVARGGYLVLGINQDRTYGSATYNGNVPVDVVYDFADFNLSLSEDTVTVSYGGTTLDTVGWTSAWGAFSDYAHAVSLNAYTLEWANDYAVNWCSSSTFIADSGMYGSPGADNEYCGPSAGTDDDGDGYSERDGDCRDDDANIHPGAVDGNDGVPQSDGGGGNPDDDADCNGTRDDGLLDDDGDGYSEVDGDCDDGDDAVHPGAIEVSDDGVDNDCDGAVDPRDVDGDGVADDIDCDDANADAFPGAPEIPYDGIDQDCDGVDVVDVDGDGAAAIEAGGPDCDDADPAIAPGEAEICDGVDQDCDGTADDGVGATWYADADADGYGDPDGGALACAAPEGSVAEGTDCDDADAARNPGAVEVCDARDNDCDDATYDPLDCGDVEEEEVADEPACGCAAGGGLASAGWLLAAVAVARRRRGERGA